MKRIKRIGIAGVGGIGSNVALNLVRSGVQALKLVDFDRVEPSNLNRQFYFRDQIGRLKVEALRDNLLRIRPEVEIELVAVRVDGSNCSQLFAACDLVVEGFDCQADKKMLLETLGASHLMVSACGIGGSELETLRSRRLGSCTLFGDFTTDCAASPLYSHKVTVVAGHMSAFILQHYEASHDHSER